MNDRPIQIERFLEIDRLLRGRERQTSETIAAYLEVSDRTIRNDLTWMRDRYYAPIEFSKQRGWHYTDPEWRLPTIPLHKGELFALTLGARMLEAYHGTTYALELRSAIARLGERLPQQTWVDLQQLAADRINFRSGVQIDLDPEIWQQLEDACREQQSVWMRYYSPQNNEITDRHFDPYLLHIYRGTNPYVIGYCQLRSEIRWFRVDRIRQLKLLAQDFTRDPQFQAHEHLDNIFQYEVGGKPRLVAIWFDPQTAPFIRERRWHHTQEIAEHPDGALTLKMVVPGTNDVMRWVLGYGKGAIVREPPELVELVREEIAGMMGGYENLRKPSVGVIHELPLPRA
jgi:predicted DNA-binding transcriptional regulator YafY